MRVTIAIVHTGAMTLLLALLVMVGVAGVDALYVLYTRHIVARQSIRAASYSGLIHLVNGFVIVQYTEDWRYLLCAAVGSIVGTYLASALPVPSCLDAAPPVRRYSADCPQEAQPH